MQRTLTRKSRNQVKKFKLKGYKEEEFFKVVVYDSLKGLRKAALKHSKIVGESDANYQDALDITKHKYG